MNQAEKEKTLKIGITMGDFNGVGPEIIIKTFSDTRILQTATPVIYGSSKVFSYYRKHLNLQDFNYNTIRSVHDLIPRKVNIINCTEEDIVVEPGKEIPKAGELAFKSLDTAVNDLGNNRIDAMVTAPFSKHNMSGAGFKFSGHTEYLADAFECKEYLMFMINESIRVAVVSGHVPLREIASDISIDKIVSKLKLMSNSLLRDFGIRKPRIAVLGLNPHAGDQGLLGNEEKTIIIPAIEQASMQNILAFGPYASDGFFGSGNYQTFDGILAMYHDQGLIPFKTIAFGAGVNFTAGLPVVRTSPDHGTGYDIAGKGVAAESSLRQSFYSSVDILKKRQEYGEISANPLKFSKLNRDR
jgi:4-hydroxythreonine-4-phosphate dehydrogenase